MVGRKLIDHQIIRASTQGGKMEEWKWGRRPPQNKELRRTRRIILK